MAQVRRYFLPPKITRPRISKIIASTKYTVACATLRSGALMRLAALASFSSSGCESVMPASLVASRTLEISCSVIPLLLLFEVSEFMAENLKMATHQAIAMITKARKVIFLILNILYIITRVMARGNLWFYSVSCDKIILGDKEVYGA